ncbi:HAMP domain-containing sensor histidine kinase [Oceanirhabdus sp. W0125-5]|uniref:HAMP domain-containing sensor histidine kinase n=1 Tax=Oceanirhabdus sp. W0125-5 TaxID=2999116 RepID=UPI0022F3155D|nr:HAMP domain-containing sensor histidine kinase [Oceanirhabdus sp. W0125-5]WBW95007.1 HAMP domain-containing sensor histidine kinase [Oceanirhabdus sp. W0125-5]
MKRKFLFITACWLISMIILILSASKNSYNIDGSFKVSINRIQQSLTTDLEKNIQLINALNKEELPLINRIEIIDYRHKTYDESNRFFNVGTIKNETVVFKPIEGTNYIVKYSIENNPHETNYAFLWCVMILTGAYFTFMIHILMLNKNIIKPMNKLSSITKQMARGYLGEVTLQYKNKDLKDFIWGLDMLRVQLSYEREKKVELEKQRRTLVAGLSHDIRTPLSSVKNYVIALKEELYDSREDKNNAFQIILDKVEVIEKLTKELLESSSKDINHIEVIPKETYMFEIKNRLNRIIHQKTDLLHMDYFEGELDENLMVLVDFERLQEVFDNLVENAIKYGDLKSIKVSYSTEDNHQLIEIHNTGTSIPKKEVKYIFNSYYRGSNVNDKPGCGLGLYISKQIMRNMQGDIYTKNTETGVSFVIVIKQA